MRILVTSCRMPYALPEIRMLGARGHEIHAADSFSTAPGMHSRAVSRGHVTSAPRYQPGRYVAELAQIVNEHRIDLVLPMFEEVFYIVADGGVVADRAPVFAPSFETLATLHDKRRFAALAADLGVAVPDTDVVTSVPQLHAATADRKRFFARPTYSRGGVALLTNTGPLAGAVDPALCIPTVEIPWLVQDFVDGRDVCSFSVVREGQVMAHATYVHPKMIEGAGGIVFESIEEPRTLAVAQRIAERTGYDGQLSLDFIITPDDELYAIECNPRATAGVSLMPGEMFVTALLGPVAGNPRVAPAGRRRVIRSALLRDMFIHWREIPNDLREIFSSTPDLYFAKGDRWPGIYQFLSLSQVWKFQRDREHYEETRSKLLAGYLHDATWNGELDFMQHSRAGGLPAAPASG